MRLFYSLWQMVRCFDTRASGIALGALASFARPRISTATLAVAVGALAIVIAPPFMPSLPKQLPVEATTLTITLAELCAFVLVCYVAHRPQTVVLSA